jgi:glyoxylase-like metal-dependent hydrolase (beta-lactamase superfamily II)
VDPSLPSEQMAALLDSRSGLKPGDIDIVYLTHAHGDHCVGVSAFENAVWTMAPSELLSLKSRNANFYNLEHFVPSDRKIAGGVEVVELPGHTAGLAGLRFESLEGRIVIASDAVMTKVFFMAGIGYFNSEDPEQTKKTIGMIRETADVIVPGHDNYFRI